MPDDKIFDLTAEIDPDYVPQPRSKTDPEKAHEMTTKAWAMSLLLPVLSILWSAFAVVVSLGSSTPFIFTAILGLGCGGIIPTVMIVRGRLDLSRFFLGKMIIIAASVAIWFLFNYTTLEYWIFDTGVSGFIYPITVLLIEIIFAAVQKTNVKTKICLALSSLVWGLIAFMLDFIIFVFG